MAKLVRPRVKPLRRQVALVVALVGVVAGGYYLIFKSDFLVIKKINCRVENKTSLADEKRWCETAGRLLLGQRIFLFNRTTAVGELKQKFLPVGEVIFMTHYPQTVEVVVKERYPAAKVSFPGGLPFLIDSEGVLYSEAGQETAGLKTVNLEWGTKLSLGQQIDPAVVELIILKEPTLTAIKFVDREGIETTSSEGITIVFSRQKIISEQIRTLQILIRSYKIEGKSLSKIDLRFDKPVVRY